MLEFVYVLAFCGVVYFVANRLDGAREAEEIAATPNKETAVVAKLEVRRRPRPVRGSPAAGSVRLRAAANTAADVQGTTTSGSAGARGAADAICMEKTPGSVGVRRRAGKVCVQKAPGSVGVRGTAGASGPVGLQAGPGPVPGAPYKYMTTQEKRMNNLWLAMPAGDVVAWDHPLFRAPPTDPTEDDRKFRWRLVKLPAGSDTLYALQNEHSGRLLQYCGNESACVELPLTPSLDLSRLDTDMVYRLSPEDYSNESFAIHTRGGKRRLPLFMMSRSKDLRLWFEPDNWPERPPDTKFWQFV